MSKPDTTTLTLHGASGGWTRVEGEYGLTEFVAKVKIAGLEMSPTTTGKVEVEADDFGIEGEYEPVLLIESAPWYTPQDAVEDTDE